MEVKRGDVLIVAPFPPFDKPRPSVVVQAHLLERSETVTVALISSDLSWSPGLRIPVEPSLRNGLRKNSNIMVDLLATVPKGRIGGWIGTLEPEVMTQVDAAMRVYLGL